MNRQHVIANASALLLLSSTTVTTYGGGATVAPLGPSTVVRSYFTTLNQSTFTRDFTALDRVYAPNTTLTERMTLGHPRIHEGCLQIRAFDRWNRLSWSVNKLEQLSPRVVLTVEYPVPPGMNGKMLVVRDRWVTLFTISHGRIVNLVWMTC
jgi:hypothetical protein